MPFSFERTKLSDVIRIKQKVFGDSRGYFTEFYQAEAFKEMGISTCFVQDNHSYSQKNVLRGLHWQAFPYEQDKLVSVIGGAIWDVAVDIRPDSQTFKQWVAVELSEENKEMLFIPKGFAHGFITLTDSVHLLYKCSNNYAPEYERSCRWNDPDLNITWPISSEDDVIISDKDKKAPLLSKVFK